MPKTHAVAALSAMFGKPGGRGVNTGCGSRFTEVVWGDLAVEFRSNRFSGYRYAKGGYPIATPASPNVPAPKTVAPSLVTAQGITLGSTLAQVRAAYRPLRRTGADWWQAPNGLIFMDDALRDPVPPTSAIVEIKVGTCGDF